MNAVRSPRRLARSTIRETARAVRSLIRPYFPNQLDAAERYLYRQFTEADMFVRAYTGRSKQERLDYPHADIYLRAMSRRERMRLRSCAKEPWTVSWIEQWVKPGDVLYDVGANVGAYTLIAAKRNGARVVAFEPGFANYAALCENIVINDVGDLVTALPVGLSSATAIELFSYAELQAGAAEHTLGEMAPSPAVAATFAPSFRQRVLTFSLDDLMTQFDLPRPSHIKIDVDGSEIAVLRGAQSCLSGHTLRTVLIEVSIALSAQVTELLAGYGLALHQRFEKPIEQNRSRIWYGLFVPKADLDQSAGLTLRDG